MALASGTRFGSYQVIEQIGTGGMGEVYRAHDAELERDIAIKVLPQSFTDDTDRVARFEQEAKTLAALNHPNIAHIYGIARSDDAMGLVMELIDGPTLADRIEQGPLPADEALGIAMQVAAALEAAHTRGIVHRDLKPANIKLKPDGAVKVLDFGIAKAMSSDATGVQSPIMTTPVTQIGVILGTAAYMSPEQARGKPVDARTDIWAFGCLLYEMLTGQLAFAGEDVAVIMARVIANDTNMDSLPKMISPAVRHTIKLCLEKDPNKRIADIRDVRLALAGTFEPDIVAGAGSSAVVEPAWRRALPWAAGLVLALALGFAAWNLKPAEPRLVSRFDYELPQGLNFRNAGRSVIAISPDGRHFVYNSSQGLYLRSLDQFEARLLPGTEEALVGPFFSADSESIAYVTATSRELKRIEISGGAPVLIAGGVSSFFGGSWSADELILFATPDGIFRVPATGGTPELVISAADGERIYGPQLLPDGDSVLFSSDAPPVRDWDSSDIVVESLATGERRVLIAGGSDARYLPTGHLVYALADGLLGIAFDAATLTVSGGPVPLLQGLQRGGNTAVAQYSISDDGTLVYVSSSIQAEAAYRLVSVDRAGRKEPLAMDACICIELRLSPDGTRVAVSRVPTRAVGSAPAIWVWSLEQRTLQRLTFEPGLQAGIVWTEDSRRIAHFTQDQGVFLRAADGTGAPERLFDDTRAIAYDFTADGQLLFTTGKTGSVLESRDIGLIAIDGDQTPRMLLATEASEARPALSPGGRWLAYQSDETGQFEIYVRPFPDVDSGKWQVSSGGGEEPQWSADGRTLYFLSPDALIATAVQTEPAFRPGAAEAVLDLPNRGSTRFLVRTYAVDPDGEHFLLIDEVAGTSVRTQIQIVQNWTEELLRMVPVD